MACYSDPYTEPDAQHPPDRRRGERTEERGQRRGERTGHTAVVRPTEAHNNVCSQFSAREARDSLSTIFIMNISVQQPVHGGRTPYAADIHAHRRPGSFVVSAADDASSSAAGAQLSEHDG